MFGRYNINDLFLAVIKITYPNTNYNQETGLLRSEIVKYEYFTILLKKGCSYIDLQNKKTFSIPMASYDITFIEPLSNYYLDKEKRTLSKKEVIGAVKTYSKTIYNKKS